MDPGSNPPVRTISITGPGDGPQRAKDEVDAVLLGGQVFIFFFPIFSLNSKQINRLEVLTDSNSTLLYIVLVFFILLILSYYFQIWFQQLLWERSCVWQL